jgi:hypothetical protein
MKINTLLLITGVLSVLYAAMLLFMPENFLEMRGAHTDEYGVFMTRVLGSSIVGYALLGILASKLQSREALRLAAIVNAAGWAAAFIVLLMAKMTMDFNSLIWIDIAFGAIFPIAFASYIFSKAKQ